MARKLEVEDPQNDDLLVLNPNQDLTINGRDINVREYGFVEGIKLRPVIQPFIESLEDKMKSEGITTDALMDVVADNLDNVLSLVAASADVDKEWVESLNDSDGNTLLLSWWTVNGPFFVRALKTRVITQAIETRNKIVSAGVTSTENSSPTDTTLTE